jgi:ion channel-forming bestrophin family protein
MIVVRSAKLWELSGYVGRPLAALFALDLAIAIAYVFGGWTWLALPDIPLSIFGGVIGVIAGFRNASAYARWWEARTIWGSIANCSRSFAREVLSIAGSPGADSAENGPDRMNRKLVLLQIAWVHALRCHLRGLHPWHELERLLSEPELERLKARRNVPLAIQQTIAGILAHCHRRGCFDSVRWAVLDRTLSQLMDAQGASERIKNTPMPRLYEMAVRVFIGIYCLLLPLGMVQSLRLLTPFGSTLVGFIFLTLDQIGRDLEEPFENLPHDIPLTAISRDIEINLKQMIDDRDIPEPLTPDNGILW